MSNSYISEEHLMNVAPHLPECMPTSGLPPHRQQAFFNLHGVGARALPSFYAPSIISSSPWERLLFSRPVTLVIVSDWPAHLTSRNKENDKHKLAHQTSAVCYSL